MPDQNFNRIFATARVLESTCEFCFKTVGVSTAPEVLTIAERAHICPANPAQAKTKAAASS